MIYNAAKVRANVIFNYNKRSKEYHICDNVQLFVGCSLDFLAFSCEDLFVVDGFV